MRLKLKYLAAIFVVFSLLLFGCIPENDSEDNSETETENETLSAETDEGTETVSKNGGGVFGNIEDEGVLPEISFDEFK